jgi:hypothetical protein
MFRRREESSPTPLLPVGRPADRVTSVVGQGISVKGNLNGSGGVRIALEAISFTGCWHGEGCGPVSTGRIP